MREQTQYKLEYKLLYSLVVAGKSAKFAEAVMARFLEYKDKDMSIMQYVNLLYATEIVGFGPALLGRLQESRSGNYKKLYSAFALVAQRVLNGTLDLKTCTPEDLEKIKGIGPKTSRFFILWTREVAPYAALDTHILKWLRYRGHKAPFSTPTGKKYAELEKIFIEEALNRMHTPGQFDEMIWRWCQQNNNKGLDYMEQGSWPEELR